MGLGLTLTQVTPNTTIASATVDGNFTAINTLSALSIPFQSFSADNGQIQSDGSGNFLWSGGLGKNTYTDIINAGGNTTAFNDPTNGSGVVFYINGIGIIEVWSTQGWYTAANKLNFVVGSLSQLAIFSGTGAGTYNHGLSILPAIVIPVQNAAGSSNPNPIGIDSLTSTTVHLDCNNSPPFWALTLAN